MTDTAAIPVENDITLTTVGAGETVSTAGTVRNDVSLGTGAVLTEPSAQSLSIFGSLSGPATGSASVLVASGGTLYLAGAVDSTVITGFSGGSGTLQLADLYLPEMLAPIGGFVPGCVLDIVSGTITDATLAASGSGEALTLSDEGSIVTTLALADTAAAGSSAFTIPDPIDGTRVVLGPAIPAISTGVSPGSAGSAFVWSGLLSGQWDNASSWRTAGGGGVAVAPGTHDTAKIAGPASSMLIVAGNAAAGTLTTQGLVALTGRFAISALVAGAGAADVLDVAVGGQLQAAAVTIAAGVLQVGLGATLAGTQLSIEAGSTLWVADSGSVGLSGLVLAGGVARLGTTGSLTIGTAPAEAGLLDIGAGGLLSGKGSVEASVGNNGTLLAQGTLQIYGTLSGSGAADIGAGSELYLPEGAAAGQQIAFESGTGTLELFGSASACAATITGFGIGDVVDIASDTVTQAVWTPGSVGLIGTLDLGASGTLELGLASGVSPTSASFSLTADGVGGTALALVPCFSAGTRLLGPDGPVAVEALRVGDRLLTRTGAARQVCWIGWRHYSADVLRQEPQLRPVYIGSHALGRGCPAAPVVLSPQHGVAVETQSGLRLVPAVALVDAKTIRRVPASRAVTYLHIELGEHDLLIAEGLAVESYLPTCAEDRHLFQSSTGTAGASGCAVAPRLDEGAALEAIRARFGLEWPRWAAVGPGRAPDGWTGRVDRVERADHVLHVHGWASGAPARGPMRLHVSAVADRTTEVEVVANRWRPDLERAGVAGGHAGFSTALLLSAGRLSDPAILVRTRPAEASAGPFGDARLRPGHRRRAMLTLVGQPVGELA